MATLSLFAALIALGCSGDGLLGGGVGRPTQLIFMTQPESVKAGVGMTPSITIAVADAKGNIVRSATDTIVVSLGHNLVGAALTGALVHAATDGVASFTDLAVSKQSMTGAFQYTLNASAKGYTVATSEPFFVDYGPATQLVFSSEPRNSVAGAAIYVTVALRDPAGEGLRNSASNITLALAANPGGAVLSGQLTQLTIYGAADFLVSLDRPGVGYTLIATATDDGLMSATSAPFDVLAKQTTAGRVP